MSMKRARQAKRDYDFLKRQLTKFKSQAAGTKSGKLFHIESVIRQKLKTLRSIQGKMYGGLPADFGETEMEYQALLRDVSERILEHYNRSHGTGYTFNEVVNGNHKVYFNSGIISVLVTNHIPKILVEEFRRLLPENPKDEYPQTRKMRRKFFLHLGETNTGKTYNALLRLKEGNSGVYLAPLRILALENYERMNSDGVLCNLHTGEEEIIVDGAEHTSCTIEKADMGKCYDVAVIDEIQLITDTRRGDAWTKAVLGLRCPEIHVCGAFNAREQLIRMISDCGDEYEIKEYVRAVPLKIQRKTVRYTDVQPGDALIAFSRRGVLSLSRHFNERGVKNSVIYGDLPPEVRRMQYDAFLSGENKILISTDAIGMGVNLPIRRIIFTETEKYDGEQHRPLTSQEVKQISGRAGRIGIYNVGYVASTEGDSDFLEDLLAMPDEEIPHAVVGAGEAILKIGLLPLKEKLALWSTGEETLAYYRKKDVRDYIIILENLQPFKLPERIAWRLMSLPFDVHNDELLALFIAYCDQVFNRKATELFKPESENASLGGLEVYYQQINLYYSFSKAMKLEFDMNWIYDVRKRISEKINRLL